MIELIDVKKYYKSGVNTVKANDNLSFTFKDKGFYIILGKSGSGKTTLLNILSGIDTPDEGVIKINDKDLHNFDEKELDEYRNIKIGIIFQQYNLLPELDVYNNLKLVLELQRQPGTKGNSKKDHKDQISKILSEVGLSGYENRKINQLSGGEQQRIAIARTLLKDPDIIFADEPTGNLDSLNGEKIMSLLKDLSKKRLVIMVTHDEASAYKYSDNILKMADGKIKETVDNKKQQFEYTLVYNRNNENREKYCFKSKEDIADFFCKILYESETEDIIQISAINRKAVKQVENELPVIRKNNSVVLGKLNWKYKFKLSYEFLKKKKKRLILTTILDMLTVMLLFFSLYIFHYNKNDVIIRYMNKYKPDILPIQIDSSYEDDYYIINSKKIDRGSSLLNKLNNSIDEFGRIGKYVIEDAVYTENKYFSDVTICFMDKYDDQWRTVTGRYPKTTDEIAVTDYIANKLGVKNGDVIYWCEKQFIISGIVKTDYIEYGLTSKLISGYKDEFVDHNCLFKYYMAFLLEDSCEEICNQKTYLSLKCSNFFVSKRKKDYFKSEMTYGNSENKKEFLICGRLPIKADEVAISETIAQKYFSSIDECIGKEYTFNNIHDERYNDYYGDLLNIYSFFPKGLKIVGVLGSEEDDITKDVYIYPDIWKQVIVDYSKYYYGGYIYLPDKNNYTDLVNAAFEAKIEFNEPAVNTIQSFDETLNYLRNILLIILFVAVGINVLMIVSFVINSINENRKNVGILRSLGIHMNDCMHVFDMEFIYIYIGSALLSIVGIIVVIQKVNQFFMKDLSSVKYNIISLDLKILFAVLLLELIIHVCSVKTAVRNIKKQKPIEIIREE